MTIKTVSPRVPVLPANTTRFRKPATIVERSTSGPNDRPTIRERAILPVAWLVNMHARWVTRRMLGQDGFKAVDHEARLPSGPVSVRLWEAQGAAESGPTVVLLHGLGGSTVEYRAALLILQKHCRRILSIDLPGHGASQSLGRLTGPAPKSGHACIDRCASVVRQALDARLGSDANVILVGHSLGGYLGARYALEKQGDSVVRKLLLVSPDGGPFTPTELETLRTALDMGNSHRRAVQAANMMWPGQPVKVQLMAPFMRAIFATPEMRYLVYSDALQPQLTPEQLAALPPVCLLWGTQERTQTPGCLNYLRKHLPPGSSVVEPDGIGHGALPEGPTALMTPLVAALQR